MFDMFIAFDIKNKVEYCSYYTVRVRDGKCSLGLKRAEPYTIGSYFLSFINTNFRNKQEFRGFVLEYCFMNLVMRLDLKIKEKCEDINNDNFPYKSFFTMEEIENYIDKLYKKHSKEMAEIRDYFIYPTETTRMLPPKLNKQYGAINNKNKMHNAMDKLCVIDTFGDDLRVEFNLSFHIKDYHYNDEEIDKNIPYAFTSPCFDNIAYISLKQLLSYPTITITKCFNCNNFFIPKSSHYTKYCDDIYKDGKTCKELGASKTFKDLLTKNPVLDKYRQRYMTLASSASNYGDKATDRFENFKIEGAKKRADFLDGKISAKKFDEWIEGTKIRKNKQSTK